MSAGLSVARMNFAFVVSRCFPSEWILPDSLAARMVHCTRRVSLQRLHRKWRWRYVIIYFDKKRK